MNFIIPFIGKTKLSYLDKGIQDFKNRLEHFGKVDLPLLKEKGGRNVTDEAAKLHEAHQLLAATENLKKKISIALDPTGKQVSSEGLAGYLHKWQDSGRNTFIFLIGGYAGLDSSVKNKADIIISLSKMTFTHEMTRLLLLEQLYRACTINAGHNYHK